MTIFLDDQPEKCWAILDADFPFNRITLRAGKALRVIYGKSSAILDVDFSWIRITLRAEKALRVIFNKKAIGACGKPPTCYAR